MIGKRRIIQLTGILLVLFLGGVFQGCHSGDKSGKSNSNSVASELRVGYIDSDKLLFEFPAFKKFRKKTENNDLELGNIVKGKKREEITNKDRKRFKSIVSGFLKERSEIKNKFVDKVREASLVVMEEKKLDLIINNATTYAVIEYGGTDVTEDVQANMTELRKQKSTGTKEEKGKKEK
ncbi:MAG: OmpH family outer membrane protein [Candidatus Eremiobacteraeota bacterium]|nr:OmpH family outer membrane protein [Candidatus Eremiobacteraeota bacterium]